SRACARYAQGRSKHLLKSSLSDVFARHESDHREGKVGKWEDDGHSNTTAHYMLPKPIGLTLMAHVHKSINVIHRTTLKQVEFTFAVGDLFDTGVDAIVSSEQTDFILSGNPESISGQIWKRYGAAIQNELDAATNGHVLPAGTVLDTSGGQ